MDGQQQIEQLMMTNGMTTATQQQHANLCAGCSRPIVDQFLLKVDFHSIDEMIKLLIIISGIIGAGLLLARGLPQVRMLRLPTRRGRLHSVHPGEFDFVPTRLPQVRQFLSLPPF